MGSNLLRILTASLVGLIIALGAAVVDAPAPGGVSPALWGLIGTAVKFVVDFAVAKLGPARPADTPTGDISARSGGKSGF